MHSVSEQCNEDLSKFVIVIRLSSSLKCPLPEAPWRLTDLLVKKTVGSVSEQYREDVRPNNIDRI